MLFSEVIGQKALKRLLTESVTENRISHAYLFPGLPGYGTLSLALAYAQYILCTGDKEKDSCGVCPSCKKVEKLIHPDLHFVFPVVTSKNNSKPVSDDYIELWREQVLETSYFNYYQWINKISNENKQGIINTFESSQIHKKLNMKSYESEYKIMIIWSADRMNIACANKILKILEEPPDRTVFMLITEYPDALLPTIVSRTQIVNVPQIDSESLEKYLIEKHGLEKSKAGDLARISYGDYNTALNYIDVSDEFRFNQDNFISFMRISWAGKAKEISSWVDAISKSSREKQRELLLYFLRTLRENLLLNLGIMENVSMTASEKAFAEKFSRFIHAGNIELMEKEINTAIYHIERNGYSKLIFYDLCIKIGKLLKMKI
ncbi:MAG: DNA polymerase III subunit delta [Marinilabiliales bacterium]